MLKPKISLLIVFNLLLIKQIYAQHFKFAFLTDMHISNLYSLNKVDSLLQNLEPNTELIFTGGDNIDIDNLHPTALDQGANRYKDLINIFSKTNKPYYLAIGNHDRLPSSTDSSKRFELFENIAGKTYQVLEHKGWKFFILNSVQTVNHKYTIGTEQLDWLKHELTKTASNQPIVVITHVPFLSVYYPVLEGKYTSMDTFENQKEVLDLFKNHKLKLVLQGHMHLYEEIKVKNIQFITAGAVSGNWWRGDYHGTAPGYLEVDINGDNFTWKYKSL